MIQSVKKLPIEGAPTTVVDINKPITDQDSIGDKDRNNTNINRYNMNITPTNMSIDININK